MNTVESLLNDLASEDAEVRASAANELFEILQPGRELGGGVLLREVNEELDGGFWVDALAKAFEVTSGRYSDAAWLLSKVDPRALNANRETMHRVIKCLQSIAALNQLAAAIEKMSCCDGNPDVRSLCSDVREKAVDLAKDSSDEEIRNVMETLDRIE